MSVSAHSLLGHVGEDFEVIGLQVLPEDVQAGVLLSGSDVVRALVVERVSEAVPGLFALGSNSFVLSLTVHTELVHEVAEVDSILAIRKPDLVGDVALFTVVLGRASSGVQSAGVHDVDVVEDLIVVVVAPLRHEVLAAFLRLLLLNTVVLPVRRVVNDDVEALFHGLSSGEAVADDNVALPGGFGQEVGGDLVADLPFLRPVTEDV